MLLYIYKTLDFITYDTTKNIKKEIKKEKYNKYRKILKK